MRAYRMFADRIRSRRKELGLTLADVAQAAAMSMPYLSELERGVRQPPTTEIIPRLAAALQLEPAELAELAEVSRRSVELDLQGAGEKQRRLAVLLARRYQEGGLSDEETRQILALVEQEGEVAE